MIAAIHNGARAAKATARPSTTAESAIINSGGGTGMPMTPSTAPNAITSGNAIGSTQIAGAPSMAPHRPTDTIATR